MIQGIIVSSNGKSPQVNPDSSAARPQPSTAPNGATTGTAPVSVGAEATTTQSQSIAAAETQIATPAPADGTSASAEVLSNPQALAVQPPIVPLPANEALTFLGVKPNIKDMTLDEKFACLKQCFAYGYGVRKVLCEVFESIRGEFKTYAKNRADMPTVEEAFKQRGLNYKTFYSAIQREKDRRTEDAQFFAAIKTEQSTKNIHGIDVTDDDLPPVGEKVVVEGGRKAVVLTHGLTGGCKTAEVVYEDDGTTEIKKAGSLVTLAEVMAAKAAAKAAKKAEGGENEEAKTKRVAAAAAKEDNAAKSDAFYATQYFALVSLINGAPKEMTPAEFCQTVVENLDVHFRSLGEDAKRVKPVPKLFPSFNGTKGMNNFIAFLSEDAIGRPSPLRAVFGGLDKAKFTQRMNNFVQHVCRMFYKDEFNVFVANNEKVIKARDEAKKKSQTSPMTADHQAGESIKPTIEKNGTTRVGDKSEPTEHGYYYEFIRDENPYAVRDMNNPHLGVLCKVKSKSEVEQYINDREREAAVVAGV